MVEIKFKPIVIECKEQPPYVIQTLPRYVVSRLEELKTPRATELPIRKTAFPLEFPLSFGDKRDVAIVMKKFNQQTFYTGLAAPQLGIMKQIIVFTMHREDCTDPCRTKVWINPSYEKFNDEMVEDYECCVSVKSVTGPVKRYQNIHYKTYDIKGNFIEGYISGVTARIIQHEIDHLEGKLFTDYTPEDKLVSMREYAKTVISQHPQYCETDDTI